MSILHAAVGLVVLGFLALAVPPLSEGELRGQSQVVVVGKISKLEVSEVDEGHQFINKVYKVTVLVEKVEKGYVKKPEDSGSFQVVATTWQPEHRPRGWVGPQGQNQTPVEGQKVRAYLKKNVEGQLEFLLPNGLEVLAVSGEGATDSGTDSATTKPSGAPSGGK
jgi:hypothetical protein